MQVLDQMWQSEFIHHKFNFTDHKVDKMVITRENFIYLSQVLTLPLFNVEIQVSQGLTWILAKQGSHVLGLEVV